MSSQTTPTSVAAIACGGAYQQVRVGPKKRFLSAAIYLGGIVPAAAGVLVYYWLHQYTVLVYYWETREAANSDGRI